MRTERVERGGRSALRNSTETRSCRVACAFRARALRRSVVNYVQRDDLAGALAHWRLDLPAVPALVYRASTPRVRWHALWLLARG